MPKPSFTSGGAIRGKQLTRTCTVVTEGSGEVPWTAESGSSMLIWYMSFGFFFDGKLRAIASVEIDPDLGNVKPIRAHPCR